MSLGRTQSVGLNAFEAMIVEVQASTGQGLPAFVITGNPDASVREGRDRVRSAIANSGMKFPDLKVTVALSPAEMPKIGSVFDLAVAVSVLAAGGLIPGGEVTAEKLETSVFLGELALDGQIRPVRGILPSVIAARRAGFARVVVPRAMVAEAALVDEMDVGGADSLGEVVRWLAGDHVLDTVCDPVAASKPPVADMSDVVGQHDARHALEIAAAGAHHVMMVGSPGIGKTMLAQRLPGILPSLSAQDSLEVTAIHSLVGCLSPGRPLVAEPPFIAPHHSSSTTALLGGGTGLARPGAVSKAHRGVLFIDECAEMGAKVLDALRQPLEDGTVNVHRRDGVASYPARFQLILAANPCPCAAAQDVDCVCSALVRRRYLGKLSGPLLDRVDIRLRMEPPGNAALMSGLGESSDEIRERVCAARATAVERWAEHGWRTNSEVPGSALRQQFRLDAQALRPIELFLRDGRVTARGADRALRLAWTLSDLRGMGHPTENEVAEALMYRDRGSSW